MSNNLKSRIYKISTLTFAIILILNISCVSKIRVYSSEPVAGEVNVIRGHNLNNFFTNRKAINVLKFKVSNEWISNVSKIKDSFRSKSSIDKSGIGIFYFAIIFKSDTLFTNSDFTAWKYKGKTKYINTDSKFKNLIINSPSWRDQKFKVNR